MKPFALGFLLFSSVLALSCRGEADFVRVTYWEGAQGCQECRARALPLPPSGSRIELNGRSVYTFALEIRPSSDDNKCVYRFASGTWLDGAVRHGHEFWCFPEEDLLKVEVPTVRDPYTSLPDVLRIEVQECTYEPRTCGGAAVLFSARYDVDWREGTTP